MNKERAALIAAYNMLNQHPRESITWGELMFEVVNACAIIAEALELEYPLPDKIDVKADKNE